jgi:hypothetical protein
MKPTILILLIIASIEIFAQSLCEWKTPELIYNKTTQSYHIDDDIKPYRIVWYSHDTIIKNSLSYRTNPKQIISIPNFRQFKVSPHVLKNGDIYFLGDSFLHFSVFKVNLQSKSYDRQFNLSDYVSENKDFLDSIYNGSVNTFYNKDSSHDINNCFVMNNDGMMYINKVYFKNFISFNPLTKTYKLIDSSVNPNYPSGNFSFQNSIYIYPDKSIIRSRLLSISGIGVKYFRYIPPLFTTDSLERLPVYIKNNYYASHAGFYNNKKYIYFYTDAVSISSNFDNILDLYPKNPIVTSNYRPSVIDGQGTMYMTKRINVTYYNEIHSEYIYTYNLITQLLDSVQMPKDSIKLSMVSSSARIDCSGSLYSFGYLYRDDNDHLKSGRHTLNLYKQTAFIDTGLKLSFDNTLKAIVYYYDADSVVLNSKYHIIQIDTTVCTFFKYRDKQYIQSGSYTDTIYNTTTGIDTIVYINLTKNKIYTDTIKQNSCDSFIYKSTTYKNSGAYTFQYKSIFNCDSFHTLDLKINQSKKTNLNYTICTPYIWNDSTYYKTGIYSLKFKTINQCDSIVLLDLKIGLNKKVSIQNGINYTALADSVSYQWYRCNPWQRITNETKKTFTTTTRGSYAVIVSNGICTDTSSCVALYSSGFASPIDASTRIYPNPFNSHLTIDLDKFHSEINIKIYDLTGRQVLNTKFKNLESCDLNLESLNKEIYYMQVETENNSQFFNIFKE